MLRMLIYFWYYINYIIILNSYISKTVSSKELVIVQIFLAIFKTLWLGIGYRTISRVVNKYFNVHPLSFNLSLLDLSIALINNIIIPCTVVAIINPDCFYNIYAATPAVESIVKFELCTNFLNGVCINTEILQESTKFYPPFYYSYQCSSRFITFYAPAFVYFCIFDSFGLILFQLSLWKTYDYAIRNDIKFLISFGKSVVPPILKLDEIDIANNDKIKIDKLMPKVDTLQIFVNFFTFLGLLMTFGALFPPLGVVFFLTIFIKKNYFAYRINRYVNFASSNQKNNYINVINKECKGLLDQSVLIWSVWVLVTCSSLFYSLFLFDTLGDTVGIQNAYWILIVMPLVPLIYNIGCNIYFSLLKTFLNVNPDDQSFSDNSAFSNSSGHQGSNPMRNLESEAGHEMVTIRSSTLDVFVEKGNESPNV